MTEERKVQLGVSVDATGAKEGFDQVKREAQSMAQAVGQAGQQAGKAIDGMGSGGAQSAQKVDAATKSMIQSIQRTTAVMEAGSKTSSKYYEVLAAQRGVPVDTLKPYLAQLDAIRDKQAAANQALNATNPAMQKMGISAAQTAAALRGVPAQFTDIITSLQGGQQPITVLLQQGGQLKDMFGGIGPAAKALGGYVVGLVNPLTIAAAAVGTLAYAYNQGSKEQDAYRKSLILSGNAAGTTANQLADAAAKVGKSIGTQGQAAAALAEMAGSGRVAAENLEYFTRVAIQMEKSVGKSAADTVKDLSELGKSPLAASEKLNDQYHYLTSSIYEQIKALQDQGKTEEAAAVAQKAYADAFDSRSKEIVSNLGFIERGWSGVIDAAKKGWDAILDVGRPSTPSNQSAGISSQIAAEQAKIERLKAFGGGVLAQSGISVAEQNIAALREQQAFLQENVRLERQMGEAAAASVKQNEAKIAWDKEGDKYLTRAAQLQREITEERQRGNDAGVSAVDIERRVGEIRKKYSDIFNDGIDSQIEAIKRRAAIEEELSKRSVDRLQFEKQNLLINDRDYLAEVAKLDLADFDRKRTNLEKELKLASGKQNSLKEQAEISGQLGLLEEQRLTRQIKLTLDLKSIQEAMLRKGQDTKVAEIQDEMKAYADFERDRGLALNETIKGVNDYAKAIDDANKLTDVEVGLLGKTEIYRNTAVEQARIQLDLEKEILRIESQVLLTADEKAQQIQRAREAAARAMDGSAQRVWLDQWKRINDDVGRSLTDALMNGGKSAGELLKGYFRTLTLRPVIEAIVSPISGAIASIFAPGVAQAGGVASSIGQAGNIFSAGKTLWDGFNTGFANFGETIATQVQRSLNFVNQEASANAMQFGPVQNSALAEGVGTAATYAAALAGGHFVGRGISNGYAISGSGNGLVNAGTVAGALLGGPLGGTIGGSIAGVINRAFGSKLVGSGISGSVAGDQFSGSAYQFSKGGFFSSDKTSTSTLAKDQSDIFSAAIKNTYNGFASLGEAVGAGGDLLKDFSYEFRLALGDFSDADKPKVIQAALARMSDSMAMAFVDTFRTSIDTAQQQASRYYTNTIDGERTFAGGVVSQARKSTPLDPYIDDIIRIFDAQKASLSGVADSEGKLSSFANQIFSLGAAFSESSGYAKLFWQSIDFKKLESAAKSGETVVDTFARLNTVFSATNMLAGILGKDTSTAFGAVGLASTEARQRLIDLAGGIDQLSAGASFFAQNFLSQEEQIAPAKKQVEQVMASLGLGAVTTKTQFADLVKGLQNLGDEASQKLLVKLFGVQSAFLQVADAAEQAAQKAKQAALDNVQNAFSAVQRSVDAERKTITQSYNDAIALVQKRISDITDSVSKLSSLSSTLRSTVNGMRLESQLGTDRAAAQAQIMSALAIAKAGGAFPEADALQSALQVVSQPSEQLYKTFIDYQRDFLVTKNNIAELADLTDAQLTDSQRMQKTLEEQLKTAGLGYNAEMSRLDGILSSAQTQIDALRGIDTSVKSVAAALAGFKATVSGAAMAGANGGGANSAIFGGAGYGSAGGYGGASLGQGATDKLSAVESLYAKYSDLSYLTPSGGAFWADQFNKGIPLSQIEQTFQDSVKAVRGYATGGEHMGGLRIVGENGPELEATGPSRIWNASQTREFLGGGNNADVTNEIRALRDEVARLRNEAEKSAISNRKVADLLTRVTQDGNSLLTTPA